jgi:hypothetical protein
MRSLSLFSFLLSFLCATDKTQHQIARFASSDGGAWPSWLSCASRER